METPLPADEPATDPSTNSPAEVPPVAEPNIPEPEMQPAAANVEESSPSSEPEEGSAETAPPPESSAENSAEQTPLQELAGKAQGGRLSPGDEERAVRAIKESLLDGRAGVAAVIELLPKFTWVVAVNGVTAAWPDLTAGFRTQLFAGLAKDESEAARRLRLSLARGIFKQDVITALKIGAGVAKDLRDKETGTLTPRNAQVFANVFIGRAKPWLAALPLAELKPADADALVHCALFAVFAVPHPPVTQLGVLKWAAAAGRLAKLHQAVLEVMTRGLGRWNGKWQNALRKEVSDLPEEILALLKAPVQQTKGEDQARRRSPEEGPVTRDEQESGAGEAQSDDEARAGSDDEDEEEDEDDLDKEERPPRVAPPPKVRPVYVSKTIPPKESAPALSAPILSGPALSAPAGRPQRGGGANFNVGEALKQIESHVAWLRNELSAAQIKLRSRDDESRKTRRKTDAAPIISGDPTADELARLNVQLEARITELQQRIADFTVDSEDRAASLGVISGEPVTDRDSALKTLLALKLQEDYSDFLALETEARDLVVQQHYRTLLRHIFDVLSQEGVPLKEGA